MSQWKLLAEAEGIEKGSVVEIDGDDGYCTGKYRGISGGYVVIVDDNGQRRLFSQETLEELEADNYIAGAVDV